MPTPRQRNTIDRFLDFMLSKPPRGEERELLATARPYLGVRMAFEVASWTLLVVVLVSAFGSLAWTPWPWQRPSGVVAAGAMMLFWAVRFARQETYRRVGLRATQESRAL